MFNNDNINGQEEGPNNANKKERSHTGDELSGIMTTSGSYQPLTPLLQWWLLSDSEIYLLY